MAITALALAACSGGGGDDAGDQGPTGAIDGGGFRIVASGPINGFGSVIVNGVRYDSSQAEILADGEPATEADLEVGQIVVVSATRDGAATRADRIEFDDNVEGPIASIDAPAGVLVVLGQTVLVGGRTSFDDDIPQQSLAGLAVGDVVEVSGHVDSSGRILATRIELEDGAGDFELTGTVSNHDGAAMTFAINALVVDYSQALLEDFDAGTIADGMLVEVKGRLFGSNGELLATRVERKDDRLGDRDFDDAEVEIEGLVTRFASAVDFDVAGIPVTTNAATEFEGGSAADLALDVVVEVEGRFDSSGTLVAREVEFEDEGQIEIDARVQSVDAASGRVVLLGIAVVIGPETRLEDASDADLRPFSVSDIRVGDWLEIRGREADGGVVDAFRAERDDAEDEARIRGFARDVAEPSFRILGLAIDTDAGTRFEGTGRATFFATAEGRLVQVDGNLNGERFRAAEVEFEDD